MSILETFLAIICSCLAISTASLCWLLLSAYRAAADIQDELDKTKVRLNAVIADQRLRADAGGPFRMPFWGVRRGS